MIDSTIEINQTLVITSFFLFIIYYILNAYPLMKIAHKTNTPYAFLAWIPIGNIFLMSQITNKNIFLPIIAIFSVIIPFIGIFISAGLIIYFIWSICEKLDKPKALSLLYLIPILQVILLFYLAYSKK